MHTRMQEVDIGWLSSTLSEISVGFRSKYFLGFRAHLVGIRFFFYVLRGWYNEAKKSILTLIFVCEGIFAPLPLAALLAGRVLLFTVTKSFILFTEVK